MGVQVLIWEEAKFARETNVQGIFHVPLPNRSCDISPVLTTQLLTDRSSPKKTSGGTPLLSFQVSRRKSGGSQERPLPPGSGKHSRSWQESCHPGGPEHRDVCARPPATSQMNPSPGMGVELYLFRISTSHDRGFTAREKPPGPSL